jgi:hypothetical protein
LTVADAHQREAKHYYKVVNYYILCRGQSQGDAFTLRR